MLPSLCHNINAGAKLHMTGNIYATLVWQHEAQFKISYVLLLPNPKQLETFKSPLKSKHIEHFSRDILNELSVMNASCAKMGPQALPLYVRHKFNTGQKSRTVRNSCITMVMCYETRASD